MKRLILAVSLVGGTALFFGCGGGGEDGGGGNGSSEFPVPLAIGNWWFSQNPHDSSDWDTTKIIGDTVYNGHDGFVGVGIDSTGTDTMVAYYADGFLNVVITEDSTEMEMKYFKQDMSVGDSWTVVERVDTVGGIPITFRVKAVVESQEDITVPAGSFNGCYKVLDSTLIYMNDSLMGIGDITSMWVAYGTGVVFSYDSDSSGTPRDSSELVDYHIE